MARKKEKTKEELLAEIAELRFAWGSMRPKRRSVRSGRAK